LTAIWGIDPCPVRPVAVTANHNAPLCVRTTLFDVGSAMIMASNGSRLPSPAISFAPSDPVSSP